MKERLSENNNRLSRPAQIILSVCLVITLLHIWGAVDPVHANWGTHLFGFFSPLVSLGALLLLALVSVPAFYQRAVTHFERVLRYLAKLPPIVNFAWVAGILLVGMFLFSVKLHLLGDGAILLRSVPLGIGSSEIIQSFRNQPLMFWIYKWAMSLHPPETAPDPHRIYFSIDVAAGLSYLAMIFWAMRSLQRPLFERVLLGCLLFFGAGSQFFFGYIENYVLQYVATTLYVLSGWLALERRIPLVVPILCFIIMVLLHLADLVFIPSLAVLIFLRWKGSKLRALIFLGAIGVLGLLVLHLIGFNPVDMTRHLRSGSVDFLQPFTGGSGNFPYPMFSLYHLLDWFMAHMLIVPTGLALTVVLSIVLRNRGWALTPAFYFLAACGLCGLFFTWVINSALGLARDWDLFSGFFTPLMVLPVYLFSQPVEIPQRRYILVVIVLLSFLHWGAWIGVNASPERHLARMKILNDPRILSRAGQMSYDEALANYFFDSQQYKEARGYYEHYLQIDSTNPRIIGNIADVYRRLNDRQNYFRMLLRAVAINSNDPGIYSNLGVEYAMRGDTLAAIAYNEKAIAMNPAMAKAYGNLGILYTTKKNYRLADRNFSTAISLGMREPVLFRYAGDVCVFLTDYERALKLYDTYLGMVPDDRQVRFIRQNVYNRLRNLQAGKR